MNILITGNSMSYLSGQPLYCYELAREFKRQGHNVSVMSTWDGFHGKDGHLLKEYLLRDGVGCYYWNQGPFIRFYPDVIFASETVSIYAMDRFPKVPVINIVHSEYDCETPIIDPRVIGWVGIRENIVDHLVESHGIDRQKCKVIYNGIDRRRFRKKLFRFPRNYKKIVVPCTMDPLREKFINHMIGQASSKYRIHFYGKNFGIHLRQHDYVYFHDDTFHIEKPIASADEVHGILLGRVNLEANSCGVPSYIYDPVTLGKELFLLPEDEFERKHDIRNVANQLLDFLQERIKT